MFKFQPLMGFSAGESKHSEGEGAENKLNIKSNIQYELGRKTWLQHEYPKQTIFEGLTNWIFRVGTHITLNL